MQGKRLVILAAATALLGLSAPVLAEERSITNLTCTATAGGETHIFDGCGVVAKAENNLTGVGFALEPGLSFIFVGGQATGNKFEVMLFGVNDNAAPSTGFCVTSPKTIRCEADTPVGFVQVVAKSP